MDNQTYLDQITASVQPSQPKNSFFSSKIFKIAIGGIAGFIFLAILGGLLGSIKNKERDLTEQLSLRMTNLATTTSNCNEYLKDSSLRAINSSFNTVLTDANREINTYLADKYNYDSGKPTEKLANEETDFINELNSALENSRLNGTLDRTYVGKANLEISLLLSLESDILARTKDEQLISILDRSTSNLNSLAESLDNYSNL